MSAPTGAALPFAAVGQISFDAEGNVSGWQYRSLGGSVAYETFEGTSTLNPDCAGAMTVDVYDQPGTLARTAEWTTRASASIIRS